MYISVVECGFRLVLATLLGSAIGLEREHKKQPAGFRTLTIICVGSTLIMILSIRMAGDKYDPARLAAQVVSGIGFLGAGAILRLGPNVKGLTTAATVWTVAGLGLAIGAGMYWEAGIVWAILLAALYFFNIVERKLFSTKQGENTLILSALDAPGFISRMTDILEQANTKVVSISISRSPLDGKIDVVSRLVLPKGASLQTIASEIQTIPGVQEIDLK